MMFPRTCIECGRRALPGSNRCLKHQLPSVSEAARLVAQPYRAGYADAQYRRNKTLRYELSGGRCESCGIPLGESWECDHLIPLRDGGTNMVENLRAYCRPCHRRKTVTDRRRRRTA